VVGNGYKILTKPCKEPKDTPVPVVRFERGGKEVE
jgi:hypothetical protein